MDQRELAVDSGLASGIWDFGFETARAYASTLLRKAIAEGGRPTFVCFAFFAVKENCAFIRKNRGIVRKTGYGFLRLVCRSGDTGSVRRLATHCSADGLPLAAVWATPRKASICL